MAEIKDDREGKNDLGISKGIYALGNSAKDGLIWGTLAMVGSFAVLALGRKKGTPELPGNTIDAIATKLEEWHHTFKQKWLKGSMQWVAKNIFRSNKPLGNEAVDPAITATAAMVGALVGKVVAVPSAHAGLQKARSAVKKYDDLQDENRQLVTTNAELASENLKYKSLLADNKPDATFADRLKSETSEVAAGNNR